MQQLIDVIPAFVVHSAVGPASSRYSQALALFHSRITVIGDTLQHFGGFLHAQAAEEAQLDHSALCAVPAAASAGQRIVERHEIIGAIGADDGVRVERDMLGAAPALDVVAPRVVDEDAAHGLRRHRKEMGAVLPLHALVVDQPHVGFVDQRRGLQAVAGALALHVVVRQTVEFVVHDRRQPGERALVPVAPRAEQRTDVVRNRFCRVFTSRGMRAARHYIGLLPFFD